jgi:hypothetical protein
MGVDDHVPDLVETLTVRTRPSVASRRPPAGRTAA